MVSWGPTRADGEKFYSGSKDAKPWVRDLNWKNQCKQETTQLEKRRTMKATLRMEKLLGKTNPHTKTSSTKIRMKMGSHGAMVPEDDQDVLLEKLAFQVESKRPGQMYTLQQQKRGSEQPETGRSTYRSEGGCRTDRSTGRSTGRSTRRSTGRSSQRSMSSIGSINTEMREIIRDTAAAEINDLKQALELEASLRAVSDQKIDNLCKELVALRAQKK